MFDAIRVWWRDYRIDSDFPAYDKQARTAHIARADGLFSVAQLKSELAQLMHAPDAETERIFGAPILSARARLVETQAVIDELNRLMRILDADHGSELSAHYDQMNALKAEKQALHEERQSAYDDLAEAREQIDGWHRRSKRTWFGNGGKKLPTPCSARASATSMATTPTRIGRPARLAEPRKNWDACGNGWTRSARRFRLARPHGISSTNCAGRA